MTTIDRPPAVAGLFYTADPAALRREVQSLMETAQASSARLDLCESDAPDAKALVVPHAGYRYSGGVAATAYARIAPLAGRLERVALVGPAHRYPFRGLAYPRADRLLTPLGAVEIDRAALRSIAGLPQVRELDRAFDGEHCLEVQLPFLQVLLPQVRVVPLLVGDALPEEVAEVLDRLWGGPETLILISSDLSHYLDYETAARVDRRTTGAIERLEPESLDQRSACGAIPLGGLLLQARRRGLAARTLDLRSSGDTAGPKDRVVGYGAYAFH